MLKKSIAQLVIAFSARTDALLVGVTIAYLGTAKLGLLLATINDSVSPVWPATGLAFASIFVFGNRVLPAIALGAFTANYFFTGVPLLAVILITIGNTLEALVGAFVIQRVFRFSSDFENQAEVGAIGLASLLAAVISATIGVSGLVLSGALPLSGVERVWSTWWVGDALGGLFVTPFLLAIWNLEYRDLRQSFAKPIQSAVSILIMVVIVGSVFFNPMGASLLYIIFLILLIPAISFGSFGIRVNAVVIGALSIWLTSQRIGPFVGGTLNENLIHLQIFLAAIAVTTMVLVGFYKTGSIKLPAIVLIFGWTLSGALFYSFAEKEKRRDHFHFQDIVSDAEQNIKNRMATYEDALLGSVGLLNASQRVDLNEWKTYLSTVKIVERYPGIRGIGVIWPILHNDLPNYISKVRLKGIKDFSVKNVSGHETLESAGRKFNNHYVITFIEPIENNKEALGLDIGTESNRRSAAELARDTGRPAMTSKIVLVQDNKKGPGFLLYHPIYRSRANLNSIDERRRAFLGWVYAPFVTESFLSGVFGTKSKEIEVYAFDGNTLDADELIYAPDSKLEHLPDFELVTRVELAQRPITFGWRRSVAFKSKHDTAIAWVGLCGAIVSLLLAGLVANLQNVNRKASLLAEQVTNKLKHSEQVLFEKQEQFSIAIQGSNDGIWDWDIRTNNVFFSERWKEMLGFKDSEIENNFEAWKKLIHPEDLERALETVQVYLQGNEKSYSLEHRLRHMDGSYRWILARGIALRDSQGKPYRMAGSHTDITAFRKANDAAYETSKAKSEFLANMSHEIRTPLNGILGMARLLIETPLNSEQRDNMEALSRSGESLLTVINDILDFSKVEAGKLDLEVLDFALRPIISDIQRTMSFSTQEKGINFQTEIDPNLLPCFKGDPGRIRQILSNLIGNAIKFTSEGHVKVRVVQSELRDKNVLLRFEIEDTGIGIPEKALARMFQSFSQADTSTTRRFGGTGLGLSISKRLVELMGGQIGVKSEEGKGSTFWFTISLEPGERSDKYVSLVKKRRQVVTSFPARILIAEDNPINQMVALKTLRRFGYRPHTVANGHEVLDALREIRYDLILMDCQMPEMDGFEATSIIRSSETLNCKDISIIAMTANALKGDIEKCLSAGMNDYISKPFDKMVLHELIEKHLLRKVKKIDEQEAQSNGNRKRSRQVS